eukprot:CAMPEP_0184493176 /NCGR_PEP_ID=MMETSP0113_2-20130426/25318_1 /TAXON_ID=91329 /ORGANISM="Norrisiella sphaerica, Strain BC52" /LENGTH=400 /DNA_ID=CAMNT_0026878357 /DNA_START=327 /DNA_END=1529 /DNA_ORIENTATION=+
MATEFDWDLLVRGQILGAFFYGYVISQVAGAYLAQLYGGKIVLNGAVFGWSLCTIVTPLAAKCSLNVLMVCRVLLGFSEGMAFPVIYHIFAGWVPKSESSRSITSLNVGTCLGTVVAFVLSPWMIERFGWESVFYFFGWCGMIWCVAWTFLGADRGNRVPNHSVQFDMTLLLELLRPSPLYAIYVCHFSWNLSVYITIMWLPTYLESQFRLNSDETWINALPYLVMAPAALGWAWYVDRHLVTSTDSILIRKVATGVGFLGGAIGLVAFAWAPSAHYAVFILSLTFFIAPLSLSGWEAAKLTALDASKAGMLQGVSNTISNFAGVIGVPLASYVKERSGHWNSVWYMCALVWAMATLVYAMFAKDSRQKKLKNAKVEPAGAELMADRTTDNGGHNGPNNP